MHHWVFNPHTTLVSISIPLACVNCCVHSYRNLSGIRWRIIRQQPLLYGSEGYREGTCSLWHDYACVVWCSPILSYPILWAGVAPAIPLPFNPTIILYLSNYTVTFQLICTIQFWILYNVVLKTRLRVNKKNKHLFSRHLFFLYSCYERERRGTIYL